MYCRIDRIDRMYGRMAGFQLSDDVDCISLRMAGLTVSAKSIIAKKRDGKELTSEEIQFWIQAGLLFVQIAPGFNDQ